MSQRTCLPLAGTTSETGHDFVIDSDSDSTTESHNNGQTVKTSIQDAENVPDNFNQLSALGVVISEIGHQINQPLHAIVNFTEASINVLEGTPAAAHPNLLGWLKLISEQAKQATQIIRQAGRLACKTPLKCSVVNINVLVRDCVDLVDVDLSGQKVRLRCELNEVLPKVAADAVQIQLVLVNLMRNAVDAVSLNPDADRELLICTAITDNTVRVSIRDNGHGLAPENSHKLFEPFFTTKPDSPGLGLALSQSIVRSHGGRLWAESNSDRGATFYFTLPSCKEEAQDAYHYA